MREWWSSRVAALRSEPNLGSALLGGHWLGYVLRRLRGFAITRGAGIALHVLEALVVVRFVAGREALVGFVIANLTLLVSGAWWGATEALRERLRELDDDSAGDPDVSAWLTWSCPMILEWGPPIPAWRCGWRAQKPGPINGCRSKMQQ